MSALDISSVPWLQSHVIPSYSIFRVKVQYSLNRKCKVSQKKTGDKKGLSATDHKSESWDLMNKLPQKTFTLTKKKKNQTPHQRLNKRKLSRPQLPSPSVILKRTFFSPSMDIGCNPETECKAQEQEGVPQPAADMFSTHGGSKPPITRK